MGTMITATIMANTKTITRTKSERFEYGVRAGCALAAVSLFALSIAFICSRLSWIDDGNAVIEHALNNNHVDRTNAAALADQQSEILARDPSDIFAWGRLAWLRLVANDRRGAFEALRVSDMLSPMESTQLPERAAMWRSLRDVETPGQQDYQDKLWFKAYSLNREETWRIAVAHGWQEEISAALARYSPSHHQEWLERMRAAQP